MLDYSVLKEQGLDGNSNADELAQNYPTLKDNFEESRFFKYCSNEDMMDVSIMVLTMISYALPKNEALKKRFTEVLEKTTKPIMDKKDLILNCRLTCLLGYYIDILYKDQPDVFNSVIKMFITSLNQQEETLALTYQSSDTLNTIINDNDIVPRMRPIINDVLTYIYDAVLVVKIPEFFDFLEEIFKFYKSELNTESVVKCVECLVARIENDLINNRGECGDVNPFKQFAPGRSNVENNEKHENTIAIQKSWVVIMRVLETEEYINQAGDQLLEKLKFMFGNLAEPKRIDFDDDIVKSMKILINSSKAVAEEMKVLFPYLENTFKKNGYVYGELFDLIKAYIKNDKAFILSNEQCLQTLFGFGITTLYHEQHVINGVIYLMQLILLLKDDQNHATDALIPDTLKEIFKRMQQQPMNSVMKRVMFLPILACMVGNFSATFTYFEQNDMTEQVVNQILKNSSKTFECPLERKLYAMTMTSLLTQQELPGCVREKSPQIITKIAHCLIKTTVEEVKEAKSKEKKKLDYLSDSDYSDSEYESSESDLSENEEESKRRQDSILALIDENDDNEGGDKDDSTDNDENDGDVIETTIDVQSNFAVMKTGFNSFDEFNYFKFVWKQLSQNHPQEMQALASNLSEKTQKAIRNLCQVQHFETNGRVVHRRIIKGKRKQ